MLKMMCQCQSTYNQSINQSTYQPTNQQTNSPTNKLTDRPIDQSISQPIKVVYFKAVSGQLERETVFQLVYSNRLTQSVVYVDGFCKQRDRCKNPSFLVVLF